MAQTVTVTIVGDATGLSKALGTAGTEVKTFESKLNAFGDRATAAGKKMTLGMTLPIVALGFVAVKAASDLNESMDKVDVVFGKSAPIIKKWSEDSATAMGISRQEAFEAAGTFGNLFRALDIGVKPATTMSMKLVQLASDLASMNDANPTDVLLALQSGLVGEVEPLRKFGVSLNQARIEAKALELGLWDGEGAISAAAKSQAAYAIILDDTKLAQGNFGDTAEGAANQSRMLVAELKNAAAQMGGILLPAALSLLGVIRPMVGVFGDLPSSVQTSIVAFAAFAAAVGPIAYLVGAVAKAISLIVTVSGGLASAFMVVKTAIQGYIVVLQEMTVAQALASGGMTLLVTAAAAFVTAALAVATGLIDVGSGYDDVNDKADKWSDTTLKQARLMKDNADALASLRDHHKQLAKDIRATEAAMKAEEDASGRNADGTLTLSDAYSEAQAHLHLLQREQSNLNPEIEKYKKLVAEAKAESDATTDAVNKLGAGVALTADETKRANDALLAFRDALIAAAGGSISAEQAVDNVNKAQIKYNEAVRDYGVTSGEARQAQLDLNAAHLAGVQATDKADQAYQTLISSILTVPGYYDAEIGRLQQLQAEHPENAAGYQLEIDKLNEAKAAVDRLPKFTSTVVNADTNPAHAVLTALTARLEAFARSHYDTTLGAAIGASLPPGLRAQGGPVVRGTPYIVGEDGPELFVPGATGMIVPNGAATRGLSAGGSPIYVTMNVQTIPTPDQVAQAMQKWERQNSAAWRN